MPQGLRTRAGELPADTTSFVGREAQVGAVKRLLTQTRLVTLTGPGGVGKTRIAIRVAREIRATFDDGVCLVTLSSLRDPELLANTVATALGLPEQQARPQLDVVVDYLTDKRLLLLLDTCEHLVDACAMLADVLMRSAPGLHIVATSRQPLDVPGEVGYPVPPLELNGDAMTLFIDRAAAIVPGFAATPANRPLIATLCRRLDGIPLAIELAVVRLRALPLEELVSRIDNRLRLLSGGMRRALERHQTLRMTIDWSHDLCTAQERLLWARLSVFAGEFGLGAVEVICEGGELTGDDVIDSLIGLVDKSVVLREDREGAAHYRMLDTVREYGAERLAALGEEDALRARHRDHYLERARRFAAEFIGPDQMTWLGWFEREQANLRLALEHCL
ncbi:MAG: LuxR family transcriptional regulator, partial [Nonomuraea sp.]|nr:LuxR family transcriptional regulator [Nonomuraea sp.]